MTLTLSPGGTAVPCPHPKPWACLDTQMQIWGIRRPTTSICLGPSHPLLPPGSRCPRVTGRRAAAAPPPPFAHPRASRQQRPGLLLLAQPLPHPINCGSMGETLVCSKLKVA